MISPLANSVELRRKSPEINLMRDDIGSPSLSYSSFDPKFGTTNLEVVDGDLVHHDELLDDIVQQAKSATKSHLIAIKKRLLEEKQVALNKAESEYLHQYGILHDEIAGLKRDLIELDSSKENEAFKYESKIDKLTISLSKNYKKYNAEFSVQKLFNAWRISAQSSNYVKKLEKTAIYFSRRSLLLRTLSTLRINCQARKSANFQAESKFKFDQVTSEMISKYESELTKLHEDLAEAYNVAQQETNKRQQMEEDLRRMFLKNMTNLNMEALSLFNTAYNAPSNLDETAAAAELANHQQQQAKKSAPKPQNGNAKQQPSNGLNRTNSASAKQAQDYVSSLQLPHQPNDVILSSNLVGNVSYHAPQDELEKLRKLKDLQLQQQYQQAGLGNYYSPSPKRGVVADDAELPRPPLQTNGKFSSSSTPELPTAATFAAAYSSEMASTTKLANNIRNTPPVAVSKNVQVITTPLSTKGSPNTGHLNRPPPQPSVYATHGRK